jgi:AcrR family transcriptional regulator
VTETGARTVGRPRDSRIDESVLDAAVREISDHGLRNFSVARVAKGAGVARATVYLRWPDKNQLILDALRHTGRPLRRPDQGHLRGDLEVLVDNWARIFNDPVMSRLLAHVEADRFHLPEVVDEYTRTIALPYNEAVERVLSDARARGEVRPDVDIEAAARCLVGGLYLEARFTEANVSAEFRRGLVSLLLTALATDPVVARSARPGASRSASGARAERR